MNNPNPPKPKVKVWQLAKLVSLDMRGRLVADKSAVFESGRMSSEIDAARDLGRVLKSMRAARAKPRRQPST